MRRKSIEELCRTQLRTAAEWSDLGRESVYEAYRYAYHYLDGMAVGFLAAWDLEAYTIAKYYASIANRIIHR